MIDLLKKYASYNLWANEKVIYKLTILRELDITELPSTDYIAYIRTYERQN